MLWVVVFFFNLILFSFMYLFLPQHGACEILVLGPGFEPAPPCFGSTES